MDIIMPQLGETVAEGTVAKWYKKVGDTACPRCSNRRRRVRCDSSSAVDFSRAHAPSCASNNLGRAHASPCAVLIIAGGCGQTAVAGGAAAGGRAWAGPRRQ